MRIKIVETQWYDVPKERETIVRGILTCTEEARSEMLHDEAMQIHHEEGMSHYEMNSIEVLE